MRFAEFGAENDIKIILLHGGGLAPWNYYKEAELLKDRYHVMIPVLDGHNGSDSGFTSIENNARSIIDLINERFGGKVFLMGGLSLGGQILVEMLSQKPDICRYAIIESALVLPMKTTAKLIRPAFEISYPLIKKHWFAKLQFDSLHMAPEFFEDYYRDSSAISKENMIAFLSANSDYKIKDNLGKCQSEALVLVGARENSIMKRSAEIIHKMLANSSVEVMQGFYHGDLSINHPDTYIEKIRQLTKSE